MSKVIDFKKFINMYRERVNTYQIVPNNSPEAKYDERSMMFERSRRKSRTDKSNSNNILNVISGLYSKFYLPERIQFVRSGIRIKMNDIVSYKIVMKNNEMKFYVSIPETWSKSLISSIKQDWGEVDIIKVKEEIVDFNPNKTKAIELNLRHHYALSLKHGIDDDRFMSSLASISSAMKKNDKLLIDFNIEPSNSSWKSKAMEKIKAFKKGQVPSKEDSFTINGIIGKLLDMINIILDEFTNMIGDIVKAESDESKDNSNNQLFELTYSNDKNNANTRGYNVQIRSICQSDDEKSSRHILKNVENSFSLLDGDNKLIAKSIKTNRGIKMMINNIKENKPIKTKPKDIMFEKELNELIRIPNKETLNEFKGTIHQDSHTRVKIHSDFFDDSNGAIPFAKTIDKEPKTVYFGGYERDWWTDKGRYVKDKTKLDDRSTATMVFGGMGSGKTSASENQALYTFGAHISDKEQWKRESKSVIVFDVADGGMINNIYNRVPEWQKDRVIILNHANFNYPIAVNNADLAEFNKDFMKDDDYAYTLAEMESKLVLEILESDKSISMDRWFTSSLQAIHSINDDWGYIEAMRALIDDEFRQSEVIPLIKNKRLKLEMNSYDKLAMNGRATTIIQTIENRFSQLEREQKLWDCIAQKPLRDENGKVKLNFRTMMDGDEDGAYMVLVHIPKSGVSNMYRRFIFSHYFTKIWNVALSRESGFGGREYRPETLVIIDEIHQIIDIPLVGKLFIDLFKEPRKYSLRLWLTLHGWSSLSKAGRGIENDIKQSIMDNGCNLIMLKGGADAFSSLSDFLEPMNVQDFNNLMNMEFCGIFRVAWENKNHVFNAQLIEHLDANKDFKKYRDTDSSFLSEYNSEYGKDKNDVRDDNLKRSYEMIESSIENLIGGDEDWENIKNLGIAEEK